MRRRLAALVVALATLGTIGATAARAATPSLAHPSDRPFACVGEKDVNIGVCFYNPVPEPPKIGS